MMNPLIERSKQYGNNTAIIDAQGTYSYSRLYQDASAIATCIDAQGTPNVAVVYLFKSSYQYVAVQWGIWLSGKMAVPLHFAHTAHEINYILEDSAAKIFIYADEFTEKVKQLNTEDLILLQYSKVNKSVDASNSLPTISLLDANALMIYTSGTTGKPKGVVTSHRQMHAQIESLSFAWQWSNRDRILNVLPMHHVHGVINITCCALYNGATVEMQPQFDAAYVAKQMTAGEITLFMAVPTVYSKLIQHFETLTTNEKVNWQNAMKRMRLMVSGSAALPIPVLEKWELISGHRLLERYGMTEIGMALSNPLNGERRPGTVGQPLPYVFVKLVDDAGLEIKQPNTPGELYVKGETVFQQYWGKPQETKDAFIGGWFKTGDVAEVSSDGYYKILGRKSSDIIKSGGYKISALEIESLFMSHPGIQECAVVALPDEVWGETIAIAIVGNVVLDELKEWLRDKLAAYKTPKQYLFVDFLPRNAMGKLLKKEVLNLF